jgi:outer membrane lipoprotein SlyB
MKKGSTMRLRKLLQGALFGLLALCQLAFMPAASAQAPQTYAAPQITGFDVQQVRRLAPGSELIFTLYGTPGADARISIAGIRNQYMLPEVEPGVYVGSYTVRTVDRLSPATDVTANLRLGNRVASVVLDESLVAGAPWRSRPGSVPTGLAPSIQTFAVAPTPRIEPGAELFFTLQGSPGGDASVRMRGVQGKIFLNETAPGRYQGSYTIRNRDRLTPESDVTAELRVGPRNATARLRDPLVAVNAAPRPVVGQPARICANCGVVEAINAVEVQGDGGYVGLIGGGVAGAVIGSQIGKGSGRTAAQILGAAGGAYAGNQIEKNMKKTTHYEVVTRLEGGGTQTITFASPPALRVGDRVRVEGNTLVPNP